MAASRRDKQIRQRRQFPAVASTPTNPEACQAVRPHRIRSSCPSTRWLHSHTRTGQAPHCRSASLRVPHCDEIVRAKQNPCRRRASDRIARVLTLGRADDVRRGAGRIITNRKPGNCAKDAKEEGSFVLSLTAGREKETWIFIREPCKRPGRSFIESWQGKENLDLCSRTTKNGFQRTNLETGSFGCRGTPRSLIEDLSAMAVWNYTTDAYVGDPAVRAQRRIIWQLSCKAVSHPARVGG